MRHFEKKNSKIFSPERLRENVSLGPLCGSWRPCCQGGGASLTVTNSAVAGEGEELPLPLNFELSESFLFVKKLSSKHAKFGPKTHWKIGAKIKFWAPTIFSVGEFASVCRKIVTFCTAYFLKPRRRWVWTELKNVLHTSTIARHVLVKVTCMHTLVNSRGMAQCPRWRNRKISYHEIFIKRCKESQIRTLLLLH